ncbi:MAG: hypothetical protein LBJ11_00545 [Oscillospiraceae bacterium]|jgi:hypothetical protein|nr:hypothetical protein [Oscillospiraceae bacterium]
MQVEVGTAVTVTYTASQTGGASGTANSTGIELTFNESVTGLTAGDITMTNDTGAAVKGALSGSGTTWTIALFRVGAQGNVTVSVANFGTYVVNTPPLPVAIYKGPSNPVKFANPSYTVIYRQTTQLNASGTGLTCESDNPRIQVDEKGKITSVKAPAFSFNRRQSATITVTDGESSDTCAR